MVSCSPDLRKSGLFLPADDDGGSDQSNEDKPQGQLRDLPDVASRRDTGGRRLSRGSLRHRGSGSDRGKRLRCGRVGHPKQTFERGDAGFSGRLFLCRRGRRGHGGRAAFASAARAHTHSASERFGGRLSGGGGNRGLQCNGRFCGDGYGGGVGVGVVYPLAAALKKKGNRVTSIIGARTKSLLILEEEMRRVSDKLIAATDDGSYGFHGFVSAVLQNLIDAGEKINRVFAIGPVPMMRVLCNVTKPYGIRTIVSLNPIMVDATGMCGACRVSVGGKTKFTCVDGPEFDGHEVDFALLTNRLRMYADQEKQSLETYKCECNGK